MIIINNNEIYSNMEKGRVFSTSKIGTILDCNVDYMDYDQILHNLTNEKYFNNVRLLKGDKKIFGSIEVDGKVYEVKISCIKVKNTPDYISNIGFLAYTNNISEKVIEQWKKSKFTVLVEMMFKEMPDESYFVQLKILDCINPNYILVFDESAQKVLYAKWAKMLLEDNILPLNTNLFTIHNSYDEDLDHYWFHTHGLNRCGCIELEMLELTAELEKNYTILERIGTMFIEKGTYARDEEIRLGGNIDIDLRYVWKSWEEATTIYRNKKNNSKYIQKFGGNKENKFLGDLDDRDESHSMPSGVLFAIKDGKIDKPGIYTLLLKNAPMNFYTFREMEKFEKTSKVRFKYLMDIFEKKGSINSYLFKAGIHTNGKSKEEDGIESLWFNLEEINGDELTAVLISSPNYIKDMEKGEVYTIKKDAVSDWVIYTEEGMYNAYNIYRYYT